MDGTDRKRIVPSRQLNQTHNCGANHVFSFVIAGESGPGYQYRQPTPTLNRLRHVSDTSALASR
jgi:hypothetical protein